MNPKLKGFLRGLGYTVAFGVCSYVLSNFGALGITNAGAATLLVGAIGLLDHWLESKVNEANQVTPQTN